MRPIINLGSFSVGEVPAPLEYQYLNATGVPIDLTGYSVVRFQWGYWMGGTPFTSVVVHNATVSDALAGKVTYVWQGDEFALPGRHAGQFFVNNSVNQFASLLLEWDVCSVPGAPPIV